MIRGVPTPAAAGARRFPVVSLLLASCALGVHGLAGAMFFQLDRAALATGQVWRLFTCHFTHFDGGHLLWDVSMFLALGGICEFLDRRRFVRTVAWSIPLISLAVLLWLPTVEIYRGLSGIDSALFGLLAGTLLTQCVRSGHRVGGIAVGGLLVAFVIKIVIEVTLGVTVFADSHQGSYSPAPLAHVVGMVVGIASSGVASIPRFAGKMQALCPRP